MKALAVKARASSINIIVPIIIERLGHELKKSTRFMNHMHDREEGCLAIGEGYSQKMQHVRKHGEEKEK